MAQFPLPALGSARLDTERAVIGVSRKAARRDCLQEHEDSARGGAAPVRIMFAEGARADRFARRSTRSASRARIADAGEVGGQRENPMGRDIAHVVTAKILLCHGMADDVASAYLARTWPLDEADCRSAVTAARILLRREQGARGLGET